MEEKNQNKEDGVIEISIINIIRGVISLVMIIIGGGLVIMGILNFFQGGDVFDGLFGPIFALIGGVIFFLGLSLFKKKP
jgi:hypothetical protein